MKHEVTSYNTRRMLADTLKEKMRRKPFSKITVSEIIAQCGVNRKTFYYHFEDIFALLKWMFEQETVEVLKHFDLLLHYRDAIVYMMDYVEKNDYIINCAYDSLGREGMKRFFYNDFMGVITQVIDAKAEQCGLDIDPGFKEYAARFYTEAVAGMLIDWVREKDKNDKKTIIDYQVKILDAALGSIKVAT